MNNTILRQIDLTDEYQPLANEKTVASVTVSAPPTNTANVTLKSADGEAQMIPGEWQEFHHINLSELQVKGITGDIVTVVGGTW